MIANPTIPFASDEELIEWAKLPKNGDRFARLWAGDTSDFGGDHSRADLALCRMLSFWCKGDFERVDRLISAIWPYARQMGSTVRGDALRGTDHATCRSKQSSFSRL